MRTKSPPDPPEDIPFWFITYSDVITLLMTFFILLLTFASSEPEMFERMQVSLFGGGGASGFAGPSQGSMEKDAVMLRVRPPAGRQTTRGSEMPPTHSDPTLASLASGIESLREEEQRDLQQRYAFRMPLLLVVDDKDRTTALGHQRLRMLANQLRKEPFKASLLVANQDDLAKAMTLAEQLTETYSVAIGKVSVGVADTMPTGALEIELTWDQG
jgi:flagellar motor protein MotB